MNQAPSIGEVSKAFHEGYRIAVHDKHFPFNGRMPNGQPGIVHAMVDHGARAIFCSQEWHDALPKVPA